MENIYSYHTFILPFIWKSNKKPQTTLDAFAKVFETNPSWEDCNIYDGLEQDRLIPQKIDDIKDAYSFYKEYQYFFPHVRNALYGFDGAVVRNFSFLPSIIKNNAHYIIVKDEKRYTLTINAIDLKIYNTGIALFVLECENHCEEGDAQHSLAAVKAINDMGRRICLPFLPEEPSYFSICADQQIVEMDGKEFKTDYLGHAKRLKTMQDVLQKESVTYISQFIKEILGYQHPQYRFTSDEETAQKEKNALFIYPALDDRMFVLCSVKDGKKAAELLKKRDDKYAYMWQENAQKDLYEYIFVDQETDCTCQSKEMRTTLLSEHIYQRWLEYDSIYAISAQSFVWITKDSSFYPYLLESFLTQYNRMAILGLAQRASLALFEREMSDVSIHSAKRHGGIKRSSVTKIMSLRQRFITYQSQLGYEDVSTQEQAIELWERIKDSFRIDENVQSLGERLEALHEAADTDLSYGINILGLLITLLTIVDIINNLLSAESASNNFWNFFRRILPSGWIMEKTVLGISNHGAYALLLLLICSIAGFVIWRKYRRRK